MRWIAIANPAAGRPGRTVRLAEDLAWRGLVERFEVGAAPGDSTRLTARAREFDGVVAIGGDGTIAAVVQGPDLPRQVLAVLPAGHGNCLARDLGVAPISASLRALQMERCTAVDLLRARVHTAQPTPCEFWVVMVQGYGWTRQMVHKAAVLCGTTKLGPVLMHQTVSATVDLDGPGLLMADGELIDQVMRIEVTCVSSALRCLAGPA
jgi:diacylglycerol kinase family enzyme